MANRFEAKRLQPSQTLVTFRASCQLHKHFNSLSIVMIGASRNAIMPRKIKSNPREALKYAGRLVANELLFKVPISVCANVTLHSRHISHINAAEQFCNSFLIISSPTGDQWYFGGYIKLSHCVCKAKRVQEAFPIFSSPGSR